MPISERFGFGVGMAIGVQAEAITAGEVEVSGVQVEQTNLEVERNVIIDLLINGEAFEITLKFRDETFQEKDLVGKAKHRTGW